MLSTLLHVCGALWLVGLLSYLLPQLYIKFLAPQNLKTKYGASWALVTGGSSGIGRAVVERLAAQGLNVVIAAFPDKVLDEAYELAGKIARNGPLAVKAIRQSARACLGRPEAEAMDMERKFAAPVFASEDAKEGPRSFLEKRPAVYKGR